MNEGTKSYLTWYQHVCKCLIHLLTFFEGYKSLMKRKKTSKLTKDNAKENQTPPGIGTNSRILV